MGLAQRVRDYMSGDDYEYEYEEETLNYAAEEPRSGYDVRTASDRMAYQVVLCCPERFEDAAGIAEKLTVNHLVILNLEKVSRDVARRLIDFLSGAAYARNGQVKRVASSTYMIASYNMDLTDADMDELEDAGFLF